jgi:predicted DNA binding CopG/RHH family protein
MKDKEEKHILDSFDKGEWSSIEDLKEQKQKYRGYARNNFMKNKRINIRISERDLIGLKRRSLEEGMPYQSLVSSVLHKFISGRLIEKEI